MKKINYLLGVLRIVIGWTFLWSFFDKLFGWGFATKAEDAWLLGKSPTFGFLNFATKGPFAEFYKSLAGSAVVDWLFMLGLLGIGVAFTFGIGVRIAAWSAFAMYALMYTAGFIPPEHNPVTDEHVVNALLVLLLAWMDSGRYLGLGNWWRNTAIVRNYPVLE